MMTANKAISVLVIDDSEPMRLSLHQVLSAFTDLSWVGESSDGRDVLALCDVLRPDVILLDVGLPHVDVPQIIRLVRKCFPTIQVIGTTSFEEQPVIDHILRSGAVVCLPKTANVAQIASIVRQVGHTSESISSRN